MTPRAASAEDECGTAWFCEPGEEVSLEVSGGGSADLGTAAGSGGGGHATLGFRFRSRRGGAVLGNIIGLDIRYSGVAWARIPGPPVHMLWFSPAFQYAWSGSRLRLPSVLHAVLFEIGVRPKMSDYVFVEARIFRLPVAYLLHPNLALEVEPALGVILASRPEMFTFSFSPRVSLVFTY